MKKIVVLSVITLAVLALFAGCGRNTTERDKQAIEDWMAADSVWFDSDTEVDSTGTGEVLFADTTKGIIWWRTAQTHDDPVVDVAVVGDSGWVEWSRHNYGTVVVWALIDRDEGVDTFVLWEKDLEELATVRGVFRKTGPDSDPYYGWELEKISCAWGSSTGGTVNIDSVHIESSEHDEWITDPLNTYYDLDELVTFHAGEDVTVTLHTNDAGTDAFIHSFILAWPFYVRAPFTNDGTGVHTGTWKAQRIPFPRWAIFDLMASSALWEEEGTYNFCGVLFPYNIVWP